MQETTNLNGKPAVRLEAEQIMWAATEKALKYKIKGKEKWIGKRFHSFTPYPTEKRTSGKIEGTIIIEKWLFKLLFKKKG